jgi:hypothetical protein
MVVFFIFYYLNSRALSLPLKAGFKIFECLQNYDFLLWIDIDAIFYNFNIPIEKWIKRLTSDEDLLVSEDLKI